MAKKKRAAARGPGAVFEVRFNRVFDRDKREPVTSNECADETRTVAAADVEDAIDRVRAHALKEPAIEIDALDKDGNETGKKRSTKVTDIVIVGVRFVSYLDIAR